MHSPDFPYLYKTSYNTAIQGGSRSAYSTIEISQNEVEGKSNFIYTRLFFRVKNAKLFSENQNYPNQLRSIIQG